MDCQRPVTGSGKWLMQVDVEDQVEPGIGEPVDCSIGTSSTATP